MQWEEGIQIRTSIMGSNSTRKETPIKMEISKMIYDSYAHHLKTCSVLYIGFCYTDQLNKCFSQCIVGILVAQQPYAGTILCFYCSFQPVMEMVTVLEFCPPLLDLHITVCVFKPRN